MRKEENEKQPVKISKGISRREFIKGAAAGLASVTAMGLVGACTGDTNTTTTAGDADTRAAGGEKTSTEMGVPVNSAGGNVKADKTIDTQIVIIGCGGAGMMAAWEAKKAGADVLVVAKCASAAATNINFIGGTAAVETSYTEEIDQKYSLQNLYERMISFAHWTVNANLLKNCVELLPGNIETLEELGVEFMLAGDRYNIGFQDVHLLLTDNKWTVVEEKVKEAGVEFMYNTTATSLLMEGSKCIGVRVESDGSVIDINADAVLAATGGYLANEEMMKDIFGDIEVLSFGMDTNTGDGIKMVLEAGGFMERVQGLGLNDIAGANSKSSIQSVLEPNPVMQTAFYGNLLLDQNGKRFMNEYMLANEPMAGGGEATMHTSRYYAIYNEETLMSMKETSYYESIGKPEFWTSAATMFDAPIAELDTYLQLALDEEWCYKADTLEDLAKLTGLEALPASVREYDAMAAAGIDTQYGKQKELMYEIETGGPYYLLEFTPSAFNTLGGVRTDEDTRALTAGFEVIDGLYVAGVENGSLYSSPYYDVGGTCSGLALSSGRLAGRKMAEYVLS